MPTQFPCPSGPASSFTEKAWLLQSKVFGAVPAPTFGGSLLGVAGVSFSPGLGIGVAVNLGKLGSGFVSPVSTSIINPPGRLRKLTDNTVSFSRVGGYQTRTISGNTLDATAAILGTCAVKLFDAPTDTLIGTTTSDGSGVWSITPVITAGPYYLVVYKVGSPDVFGTSSNVLLPTVS